MSVYRESAAPAPETIHEFPVSTRRGHALVVLLGTVSILLLVAWGVSVFGGTPPGLGPWVAPMGIAGAVALVGAVVLHRRRRRQLLIVRTGDAHHLVVERENVRIAFPLGISGDQFTESMRGIPIYHVYLKLADANGRGGVFIEETRGAIHGPQEGWLTQTDRSFQATRFESGRVGTLAQLRAAVEAINARTRGVQ